MTDPSLKPRILAIDDTPANLQVLTAALAQDFRFQIATSGAVGLAAAARTPPDLILLDVMMPGMDGFEVCRRLKADPLLQAIPVIFLTANSETLSEEVGLELGAVDYITKPIKVGLARLRIRNLMEREALRKELASQRDSLAASVRQLKHTAQQLQEARLRELEIGNAIQRDLLQGELPPDMAGVCLSRLSTPSQIVDGDFSVIHRLHADCFDVLVGDVMGKGVPAALIGAGIRSTYHQVLSDLLMTDATHEALPSPAQIVNQLHQVLTPRLSDLASFATLALYRFDLAALTLTFVNAGHTPALLLRAAKGSALKLLGENLPIGVMEAEVYTETAMPITPADVFLLFSDGITEARDAQGQEFGLERLCALFESWPAGAHGSRQLMLESINQTLHQFCVSTQVIDDQSLLLIELLDKKQRGPCDAS
jgi:serine phosphatase RsbU (regulator of sigma subunit)